jgi:hypothetical protein
MKFMRHAQTRLLHRGHAIFQVDDFDGRGLAGHESDFTTDKTGDREIGTSGDRVI